MNNRKISTWLCFAVLLFYAAVLTSISPLLAEISKTYNLSMAESGFLFTVNFVGFSVFILFGGIASDYWGKKAILGISLVTVAVALAMFPLASNFIIACLAMFFIGGCNGVIESIANALIVDLNPEKSGLYVNLAQIFFGIGALIGPIVIGMALEAGVSWQTCYYVLSILFVIISVVFYANKLPALPPPDKVSLKFLGTLVTDKKFLLICLCMFLYTGAEVGAWGWMSTFMQNEFKFSVSQSSVAVGVFWTAIVVGRFLCTIVNMRIKTRIIIIVLAFFSVIVSIFTGLAQSELQVWLTTIILGLALSGQWSLIAAYGSDIYRKSSGTIIAALVGSGGVGMAVIPFIMGVIGQYVGVRASMMSTAVFFLGIGLVFMVIDKIKPKKEAI